MTETSQDLHREIDSLRQEVNDLKLLLEAVTGHSDRLESDLLEKIDATVRESEKRFRLITETNPLPIFITRPSDGVILYANAPARNFQQRRMPGFTHYRMLKDGHAETAQRPGQDDAADDLTGTSMFDLTPWLKDDIQQFHADRLESAAFEKGAPIGGEKRAFRVNFFRRLDISGKFDGVIVILEDVTSLKNALDEVKTLRGFLPICAYCKKIRDDEGFWQQVEKYVSDRSAAVFSHGICPECARRYYPDMDIYDDEPA